MTALRGGRPLATNLAPAIGDVIVVNRIPFKLTSVIATGRSAAAHRVYRFTDREGRVLDVTPARRTA